MEAEQLAERISVRLQHANSAVVLTTIKVILYLMNYMEDEGLIRALERKMGPPLGELWRVINNLDRIDKSFSNPFIVRFGSAIRRSPKYPPHHPTPTRHSPK